ncbi:MAG: iron ABC transporter permease [Coriobacteriia bacterium]|nr:iron ABC transporter permease [Coriobacteriia bacterium]
MARIDRQPLSYPAVIAALIAVLASAMLVGVAFGAVPLSAGDVIAALGRRFSGSSGGLADTLVVDVRLPRVLIAALVGASLAAAGTLYQALFRNPLADPYILGVSSGAGLGAMVALTATAGATVWRFGAVPAGAFAGALLTMILVVRLASSRGRLEPTSLLLAGVAVSYVLAALTSFIMLVARQQMMALVYWMMGGLSAASWQYVAMIAPMFVLGILLPLLSTRELNLMLLGDERAGHLGLSVERFKLLMLAAASLLTAAAVAVSGLIGFVGLMTPHIMRRIVGPDHRRLLPASLLAGASVLVLSDLAARMVIRPVEIPVGIVTAVLGGPFFIWLLVRGRSR